MSHTVVTHLLLRVPFVAEVDIHHGRYAPPGAQGQGGVGLAGVLAGSPREPSPPPTAPDRISTQKKKIRWGGAGGGTGIEVEVLLRVRACSKADHR